jgi:hypothetical protein
MPAPVNLSDLKMHVHLQRVYPEEKAGGVDQQTFPPSKRNTYLSIDEYCGRAD